VTICKRRSRLRSRRSRNKFGQGSVTTTILKTCLKLVSPELWTNPIGSEIRLSDEDNTGQGIKQKQQSRRSFVPPNVLGKLWLNGDDRSHCVEVTKLPSLSSDTLSFAFMHCAH
jgi:hypothetical protein